jgi:hypothetical protein
MEPTPDVHSRLDRGDVASCLGPDGEAEKESEMLSTLKTTDVRSRIEPELKDRAAEVLAECGLNLSAIEPGSSRGTGCA